MTPSYAACLLPIVRELLRKGVVVVVLCLLLAFATAGLAAARFATETGSGPDKWASVWLIVRFIDESVVDVYSSESTEHRTSIDSAIEFDVVGSPLGRTGSRTTYSTILAAYSISDQAARSLGDIVHEIEIDAWARSASLEAKIVELAFRRMQTTFGRDAIAPLCYLRFFDKVTALRVAGRLAQVDRGTLLPDDSCMSKVPSHLSSGDGVPLIDLTAAAMHTSLGADVTFLDTREAWEFEEGHIPGAINMPLRDISAETVVDLLDDDLVIAYCVKDFRGYEAAKRLRSLGVDAAIMKPYGMRGWIEAGLPVAGTRGLPSAEAHTAMEALARAAVESP